MSDSEHDDADAAPPMGADAAGGGKSGFLERRLPGKKKAKFMWFTLAGSTLFAYGDPADVTHKQKHEFQGAELTVEQDAKKKHVITFSRGGKELFSLIPTSKADCDNWEPLLRAALAQEPGLPPEKVKQKKQKGSAFMRVNKAATGKIVTSGVVKSAVRTAVNEETKLLLVSLRRIIAKAESAKKADEIENNIMKILNKSFWLEKQKLITLDQFLRADEPLRESFELLVQMRDYRHRMRPETVEQKLLQVHRMLQVVEQVITDMLIPHLKPKSMQRIGSIFGLLGSVQFLNDAWSDPQLEEERNLLADAMNRYTQFHF